MPVETDTIDVFLDCPERPEKRVQRRVVRVTRCECRNVQIDPEYEDTRPPSEQRLNDGGE